MSRRLTALGILLLGLVAVCTATPQGTVKAQTRFAAKAANTGRARSIPTARDVVRVHAEAIQSGRSRLRQVDRAAAPGLHRGANQEPVLPVRLCTTIGLLLMTAVCTKLWIDHRRGMWITAEMMADIYNQDAYSRRVAQEAIERYNTHIERCNRAIEAAEHGEAVSGLDSEIEQLRSELLRVAGERDTATRERDIAREDLQKKSEILAEMSVRLDALTNQARHNKQRQTSI